MPAASDQRPSRRPPAARPGTGRSPAARRRPPRSRRRPASARSPRPRAWSERRHHAPSVEDLRPCARRSRPSRTRSTDAPAPRPGAAGGGRRRSASGAARRPAPRRSPGGTSRPGRRPSLVRPSASGNPPTAVAMTGSPRASASVTTMPYVSACEASTSTSAVGVRVVEVGAGPQPGEADPLGDAGLPRPGAAGRATNAGSRSSVADADAPPGQVRGGGQRGEQHVVALVRGHRGDAQQLPAAVGPRRPGRPGRRRAPPREPCPAAADSAAAAGPGSRSSW